MSCMDEILDFIGFFSCTMKKGKLGLEWRDGTGRDGTGRSIEKRGTRRDGTEGDG